MVSAGVCDSGKGRLHFVDEKVKVNAEYYMKSLLPGLLNDCHTLLGDDFIFQQDGAPAHTARQAQQFLQNCCAWRPQCCPQSSSLKMNGRQIYQI